MLACGQFEENWLGWSHFGDMNLAKILTFCRSYMTEYFEAYKFKEVRNCEYKVCLSRGAILHLLDVFSLLFTDVRLAVKRQSERLIFKTDLIFYQKRGPAL
jgi:hypothetical protein